MTEPTLEPGDNWEAFLKRTIIEKCGEELALATATTFEQDTHKGRLSELWYHIDCAKRHLGDETKEIRW